MKNQLSVDEKWLIHPATVTLISNVRCCQMDTARRLIHHSALLPNRFHQGSAANCWLCFCLLAAMTHSRPLWCTLWCCPCWRLHHFCCHCLATVSSSLPANGCLFCSQRDVLLNLQPQQPLLLHQSRCQATPGLETGRWGRKVGREGSWFLGEKTQEEERCAGGPGARIEQPGSGHQVRHHPTFPGWPSASVTPEGLATRDLLQGVALARSAEPSWTETAWNLRVSILCKAEGGVHQPVPLQESGKSRSVYRCNDPANHCSFTQDLAYLYVWKKPNTCKYACPVTAVCCGYDTSRPGLASISASCHFQDTIWSVITRS